MIESNTFTYEMSKLFLRLFVYLFFPLWIIFFIYLSIENNEFLTAIIPIFGFYLFFIYLQNKSKTNYYTVKMDDDKILCKIDGQTEKEINWNDVLTINRIPLITPPMYLLKTKKTNEIIVFPTSSHFGFFSFGFSIFLIIWDFSKMGKFIREIKEKQNIDSLYSITLRKIYNRIIKR